MCFQSIRRSYCWQGADLWSYEEVNFEMTFRFKRYIMGKLLISTKGMPLSVNREKNFTLFSVNSYRRERMESKPLWLPGLIRSTPRLQIDKMTCQVWDILSHDFIDALWHIPTLPLNSSSDITVYGHLPHSPQQIFFHGPSESIDCQTHTRCSGFLHLISWSD